MAKWTITRESDTMGTIVKDNAPYFDLDISWLPSNIRAVQSSDGVEAAVEYNGEQIWYEDITTQSWWSNVSTTWDAGAAALAADLAAKYASAQGGD